jgi:hypothetical protein
MVTERTTEGARPAIRAKEAKDNRIRINLERAFCVLGIGLRIKVKTANRNPTCNPETDKICMAPAYW